MKALSNAACIVGVDESDEIGVLPGTSQLTLHLEAIANAVRDAGLRIRDVDAGLLAARRFSGGWRGTRWDENEAALRRGLERAGLEPVGATIFARYDAPFVPWFLRRNEVLVEVREPAASTP